MNQSFAPIFEQSGNIPAPLRLHDCEVIDDWIDVYNHVNVAHYLTICDQANWTFWNRLNWPNCDMETRGGDEYVIVENHIHYLGELALGEQIYVTTQLVDFDDKRLILFHNVLRSVDNTVSATNEVKFLGFNLNARKAQKWKPPLAEQLALIHQAHASLPRPKQSGQGIGL